MIIGNVTVNNGAQFLSYWGMLNSTAPLVWSNTSFEIFNSANVSNAPLVWSNTSFEIFNSANVSNVVFVGA